MVKIIKQGNIERKKKQYHFKCCRCRCEFIADIEDMKPCMGFWSHEIFYKGKDERGYEVGCPTCGQKLSKSEYDYIRE